MLQKVFPGVRVDNTKQGVPKFGVSIKKAYINMFYFGDARIGAFISHDFKQAYKTVIAVAKIEI